VPASERKKKVEAVLEKMQMMHRRNHFPQQLSGGQQQRVAVARAVINNPKLILADEPTGNLDSSNGNEVMQLLTELNDAGATVIIVTHSNHDAAYSHRIIRLLDGQVVMENINEQFAV
jgi:putative ABC transport system ATP-binding protein